MGDRKGSANREPQVRPTRAHPRGHLLVSPALRRATALVTIVRDEDANRVAQILDGCTWEQMAALIVVLAAMVPDDQSVADLTAWVHEQTVDPLPLRSVG